MRAILDQDRIVKFTINKSGVEVGSLPTKNVGLGRLRFDGERIVDLITLNEFWVDRQFILHVIETPGSQKITMEYRDKDKLINDNGIIRVKIDQEIEEEKEKSAKERKRLQIKRRLKKEIGHNEEVVNDLIKFVLNDDLDSKKKLEKYLQITEGTK